MVAAQQYMHSVHWDSNSMFFCCSRAPWEETTDNSTASCPCMWAHGHWQVLLPPAACPSTELQPGSMSIGAQKDLSCRMGHDLLAALSAARGRRARRGGGHVRLCEWPSQAQAQAPRSSRSAAPHGARWSVWSWLPCLPKTGRDYTGVTGAWAATQVSRYPIHVMQSCPTHMHPSLLCTLMPTDYAVPPHT